MKRKFVLLPLTLTAFTPMISMAACNNSGPEVKVDSGSDITDIKISVPKIILNQELIITYEMINQEKVLDINNSWIKFDSSQFPLSNPEFKCENNKIIVPAEKVTTYDITICLKSMDPDIPTSIELSYGQGLKDDIEITHDQTLTFSCVVYPSTAAQDFVLESPNRSVADFDGNTLIPNPKNNSGGTIEIVAKCKDYPSVMSNIIRVTVKPKPSTLSIDYSEVNFDTTMTIGEAESMYQFQGFDADFIFLKEGYTGDHTVTPSVNWKGETDLPPLSAKITNVISDDSHTTFGVEISCSFTEWVVDKEYYYSLSFLIDGGEQEGGKTINVDKNLCFVNHNAQTQTIVEPIEAVLVPDAYGDSVTIKGCSANFNIGSTYGNTLEPTSFIFVSGDHFAVQKNIVNLKNTTSGSTFDIQITSDGIDLSEDIVFSFSYELNGIKIKQSQNYTIKASQYIKYDSYQDTFTLDDFDTPSATLDGFIANFEFDNASSSDYPVITASCEAVASSFVNPTTSIVNIEKGTGYTTFSVKIDFDEPIVEPLFEVRYNLHFKIDGEPLVSSKIMYFVNTPTSLQYLGDGGQQQFMYGKYYTNNEEQEGYFTNVGIFKGNDINADDITAEVEWNTSNALPTPTNIFVHCVPADFTDDEERTYLTLVWPDTFDFGSSTFKLKIYVEGNLTLTVDNLSLITSSSADNFWDIETTFVGSTGTAAVSTNTQDKFVIDLSGYEASKELWGVEFSCGNGSIPMVSGASINTLHNQITVEPNWDECHFIPGLKVRATITYVLPNNIIPINQIEQNEMLGSLYTSDQVDWQAGKTYYLRANLYDSPFVFDYRSAILLGFIGEVESAETIKPISEAVVYNNFVPTEYAGNSPSFLGMVGFYAWAKTASILKNNVMDFTIKVNENFGKQKFKITAGL